MLRNKGFSLIELTITITVIVIVYAIAIPTLSYVNKTMLNLELKNIYILFTYLKQKSITKNQIHKLVFNVKKNFYTYQINDRKVLRKLPYNLKIGILEKSFGPPSKKTGPLNKPVTFINNKVIFYPDGKISPGSLYLKSGNNMVAITCPISKIAYIRQYN